MVLMGQKFIFNPSIAGKLILILKIARPRTWMFANISYLFAGLQGNRVVLWQLGLGIVIFSLLTGATNMINAYTDIEEDRINNFFRVKWLTQIGSYNLIKATVIAYLSVIVLSLILGPSFTLIVVLAVLDSIFYSLPPLRFKKHPIISLLSFSGAVGFPFLAGLAIINKIDLYNPVFILLTLFMMTYGTVKNIPDFIGDKLVGLKTSATIFKNQKSAIIASTVLLTIPYLSLIVFIGLNILDKIYAFSIPLIVFPFCWAYVNLKTEKREMSERLHTYGFMYAIFFLLYTFLLTYPSITSLTITVIIPLTLFLITKFSIDSRKELPINLN